MGDSTDGPGFIDSLRGDEGFDPAGCRCLVLGTGGAARSVTLALAEAGAGSVVVVGRNAAAAEACAELAGSVRERRPARATWPPPFEQPTCSSTPPR